MEKIDSIKPIGSLDLYKVREVMTSSSIPKTEKIKFIKQHKIEIKHLTNEKISGSDFKLLMENRPLKLLRPIKNKYTKIGDRKIIAIALGISPLEVNSYIKNVTLQLRTMEDLNTLGISKDNYEKIKTYVYRHGTKDQVIDHLDYELHYTKDILKSLYNTLDYNSCGVANYFLYPIHRLDNNTMLDVYNTIDKNLKLSFNSGKITETDALSTAEWALARIYEIQNNQHLQNAIKLRKKLG